MFISLPRGISVSQALNDFLIIGVLEQFVVGFLINFLRIIESVDCMAIKRDPFSRHKQSLTLW